MVDASNKRVLLSLTVLTAVAAELRFYQLGKLSLWYDEILTVWNASHSFREIPAATVVSPPLYQFVVRCFLIVFGKNDFWLRVPSAFFGTITIPFAYFVLNEWEGAEAAFWGTLLWSLCPFAVLYSHELRMYSLVPLEALASLYHWNRALEKNQKRDWAGYAFWILLGLYTHNWFLFFFISQFLGLLALKRKNPRELKRGILCFAGVALFYAPWIPHLIQQANADNFGQNHVTALYHVMRMAEAFAGVLVPHGHSWVQADSAIVRALGIGVAMILLLHGLLKKGIQQREVLQVFIFGGILPVCLAYFGQTTYKNITLYANRYTIIAFPAFMMVIARGIGNRNDPWHRPMVFLACIWISCWSGPLRHYFTTYEKAPWKEIGAAINAQAREADAVSFFEVDKFDRLSLEYYLNPSLKIFDAFQTDTNTHRLFLPVHIDQMSERTQKIPAPWRMKAWFSSTQESVLLIERIHS